MLPGSCQKFTAGHKKQTKSLSHRENAKHLQVDKNLQNYNQLKNVHGFLRHLLIFTIAYIHLQLNFSIYYIQHIIDYEIYISQP